MATIEQDILTSLQPDEIQRVEQFRKSKRTAVLAIMFTDIVGFTEMTEEHGEQASAKLRHLHDEIFTNIITKDNAGEIIKQIGDSFLAVFAEPSTAVLRAIEFQDALSKNAENLTIGNYSLKVRIGIHMGQVSVEDAIQPDIFGRHVNRAARVMDLAKGGQVLATRAVWDSASGWLREEEVAPEPEEKPKKKRIFSRYWAPGVATFFALILSIGVTIQIPFLLGVEQWSSVTYKIFHDWFDFSWRNHRTLWSIFSFFEDFGWAIIWGILSFIGEYWQYRKRKRIREEVQRKRHKDEKDIIVEAVSYGKTRLKGIGGKVEIFEVYENRKQPKGLPKTIKSARRKKKLAFAACCILLVGLVIGGDILLSPKEDNRLFIPNIVSNESDIPIISKMLSAPFNPDRDKLVPIPDSLLKSINEKVLPILFVRYGHAYEVITYSDIEKKFMDKRENPPKMEAVNSWKLLDKIDINSGVFLHAYRLGSGSLDGQYIIFGTVILQRNDFKNQNWKRITIYSDIDDITHNIGKELNPILRPWSKKHGKIFPSLEIVSVEGGKIIFSIHEAYKGYKYLPIKPGYILRFSRRYSPYKNKDDAAVVERISDLEDMLEYCRTHKDWEDFPDMNNRDGIWSSRYFWSIQEYNELRSTGPIQPGRLRGRERLGVLARITDVYDSTGVAIVLKEKYPWVNIKSDDKVSLYYGYSDY